MARKGEIKDSILNYVENFMDKRDTELRSTTGDDYQEQVSPRVSRDSIVINAGINGSQDSLVVSIFVLFLIKIFL